MIKACNHATALTWYDNEREKDGDYVTLARLYYHTMELEFTKDCRVPEAVEIRRYADKYKIGDTFHHTATQSLTLGHGLKDTTYQSDSWTNGADMHGPANFVERVRLILTTTYPRSSNTYHYIPVINEGVHMGAFYTYEPLPEWGIER